MGAPVIESLLDPFFEPVLGRFIVVTSFGEIGLGREVAFVVVGVKVLHGGLVGAGGFGEFLAELGAQVLGNGEGAVLFHILHGSTEGCVGAVGLGCGGEIDSGVGEGDPPFRHAEELKGLLGGEGDPEGVGVGQSDILGGGDDQSPGDEARILASVEHLGHPVEGGVGVGAPDRFDEGRDGVVVLVSIRVIDNRLVLDGLPGHGEIQMDAALVPGSGEDGEFKGGQGLAGIPVRFFGQVLEGVLVGLNVPGTKSPLRVREGAPEDEENVVGGEGFELEDLGAGDRGS